MKTPLSIVAFGLDEKKLGAFKDTLAEQLRKLDNLSGVRRFWVIDLECGADHMQTLGKIEKAEALDAVYIGNARGQPIERLRLYAGPIVRMCAAVSKRPLIVLGPDVQELLHVYQQFGMPVCAKPLAEAIHERVATRVAA